MLDIILINMNTVLTTLLRKAVLDIIIITNIINMAIITTYRKVMLDGVGEEESLVATGGAADHLAVVYNTDDQVTFFMMTMIIIMAWHSDGHLGCC